MARPSIMPMKLNPRTIFWLECAAIGGLLLAGFLTPSWVHGQTSQWKLIGGLLQPNLTSWTVYASGNFRFDGEIMPDGATCANGEILKKTAANDWDCAADATGGGWATTSEDFYQSQYRDWAINAAGYLAPTTTKTLLLPGGLIATASSTIVGHATTTGTMGVGALFINGERFTDLTGTGLSDSAGALTVGGLTTAEFASANVSQWTNNANYITLASLSGTAPISYNNGTGAISCPTCTVGGLTLYDAFAHETTWGATNSSTGTPMWLKAGLNASSTSHIDYATTTFITTSSFIASASSTAQDLSMQRATSTRATSTTSFQTPFLGVGTDYLSDITGSGLAISGNALTVSATVGNITNYDWTFGTTWDVLNLKPTTTKPIWATGGLNASSTSHFNYASTTQLSVGADFFSDLTGTGLQDTSGALNVIYGSSAGNAAQGNVTLTGPSGGTGLTGTGNAIAVGAGGTFNNLSLTVPVVVANGGTNNTSAYTTNGVNYFDGTKITNGSNLYYDPTNKVLGVATSTQDGVVFAKYLNSGFGNISGQKNGTSTYLGSGSPNVLGAGGNGYDSIISSGSDGVSFFGEFDGGLSGNVLAAAGGLASDGLGGTKTTQNDGRFDIGNPNGLKNAFLNVYGTTTVKRSVVVGTTTTNYFDGFAPTLFVGGSFPVIQIETNGGEAGGVQFVDGGDSKYILQSRNVGAGEQDRFQFTNLTNASFSPVMAMFSNNSFAVGTTTHEMGGALLTSNAADNGVAGAFRIDATSANCTTADTFINFMTQGGVVGNITCTAVSGTIIYNTFTGSHWTKVADLPVGLPTSSMTAPLLLCLDGTTPFPDQQHLSGTRLCDKANSKAVYGVYGGTDNLGHDMALSIGVGYMLVSNQGKDIENGDLLTSSGRLGEAGLQLGFLGAKDDVIRNYTVARSSQNYHWANGEKRHIIRVIYIGG